MKYAGIPILMYHEIGYQNNQWCVSPTQFEEQMLFLKEQGYRTITLSELQERMKQNKDGDERGGKLVVLTFDDGRKGVYRQAYPRLKRLGFTATIYIVPDWVEGKMVPEEEAYSEFLSWDELQEVTSSGFEIGSHSLRHQDLTLLDEKTIQQELAAAEDLIVAHLGKPARHFAYPHGKFTSGLQKIVQGRYETAVTIEKGFSKWPGKFARQWVTKETSLAIFQKLLQKPILSVCLIVKDEENFLEECLASVQEIADEIIVVDTGSTDKTKEIARRFTEQVFDFPWNDDFAAARNESLRYARGDWVLVLDADEVIAQQDQHFIVEAMNNWTLAGYRLLTRNYSNDSSLQGWVPVLPGETFPGKSGGKSFTGWHPSLKVRLFQRKPEFRFLGKVHELVDGTILQAGGVIRPLPVPIHHYGVLKGQPREKLLHHLALQHEKIGDYPRDAKAHYELGIQHLNLGQFPEAEKAFLESLRLDAEPWLPLLNLALARQKQGNYETAIETYQQVLVKNAGSADACFGLGFCQFQKGELEKATEYFRQAITFNPLFIDAYLNLGAVYERLAQYPEAAEALWQAAQLSPRQPRIYYNMGVIQEKVVNVPAAIRCYEKAIELNYARKEELKEKVERMKRFMEENGQTGEGENPAA